MHFCYTPHNFSIPQQTDQGQIKLKSLLKAYGENNNFNVKPILDLNLFGCFTLGSRSLHTYVTCIHGGSQSDHQRPCNSLRTVPRPQVCKFDATRGKILIHTVNGTLNLQN